MELKSFDELFDKHKLLRQPNKSKVNSIVASPTIFHDLSSRKTEPQLEMAKTFYYFAYGSNLLAQRIHINNPSATRYGIGELPNYQLDFNMESKAWKGATATIVPKAGVSVWGAIWEISEEHLASLDEQEGVASKKYVPLMVDVKMPNGTTKSCRVYQQTELPEPTEDLSKLPEKRQPSGVYLKTILQGAEESGLPHNYRRYLARIKDNGYNGAVGVPVKLDLGKFRTVSACSCTKDE